MCATTYVEQTQVSRTGARAHMKNYAATITITITITLTRTPTRPHPPETSSVLAAAFAVVKDIGCSDPPMSSVT